ncbi:MAG: sugar phosphate isomerase/epimerase family protein [Pirellulales bacterium]
MILKRQKLGAIALTKEIGADGLELDMGPLGDRETFENGLANEETRKRFQEEAERLGITFCSIAMSGFYAQSFAERPTYRRMITDCITTMNQLNVKVGFLPLGVKNDLVQFPDLRPTVVQRLKEVGKMAQDANVTIGIESALDAEAEVRLLDDIGSPAVRCYFNFANALQQNRNLFEQLKVLGKDRICQIHCTDEDGVWLENNKRLDMAQVKKALVEMNWKGWLVMERSRDANNARDVKGNYGANARYLKKIFSP